MKYIMLLLIVMSFIISAFMVKCSKPEQEIIYTYEGEFPTVSNVDFGNPLFFKVDKYYIYDNNLNLEENSKFDPILLEDHFITIFDYDSLSGDIANVEFEINRPITGAIMFASGSNRFNNVRFSAGEPFIVRIKK